MCILNLSFFLLFLLAMGCVNCKSCYPNPSSTDVDSICRKKSPEVVPVPSHNIQLQYSALTQQGYYPGSPGKENQDSFCIKTQLQGNPNVHFFGVFDGHGLYGAECSNFVKDRLVEMLSNDSTLLNDPVRAYNAAFMRVNSELHSSGIDDSMSGTTAITAPVIGDTVYVANVGYSRAVIAVKNGDRVIAEDLSNDQTPLRRDEYERVRECGARVLSLSQAKGYVDPEIQKWDQGEDPPRVWLQNGNYPGTAFTRSVGDSVAEGVGVVAYPEVSVVRLRPEHLFFVVASDGVFEFLSSQSVVDMVAKYSDPKEACAAIAGESYKLWLDHESRTDDITIIVVHLKFSVAVLKMELRSVESHVVRGHENKILNFKWLMRATNFGEWKNIYCCYLGSYQDQVSGP